MSIDLFTVFAQIFNFVLLLFILNKILIKPLLKNMEDRRKGIENKLSSIEERDVELQKQRDLYESKIIDFENFKKQEKQKLEIDLQQEKDNRLNLMSEELNEKKEEFITELNAQKNIIIDNISRKICKNLDGLLKNIFISLKSVDLEKTLLDRFIEEIKTLDDEKINTIILSLNNSNTIEVITSFSMDEDYRNKFNTLLKKELELNFSELNFIVDDGLILGIKLKIGGYILSSNIQNIIEQFNKKLEQLF